jgi:ABC-type uncharacterized transport system auxiliary subunit
MTALHRALALAVALACGGCSFARTPPAEQKSFLIEPPPPAARAARRDQTLRVGVVRVDPSFSTAELVYRFDEVRFEGDFYNRLMSPPGTMLAARIAEWLEQAGPFRFVAPPGARVATDFVLEAVFTDLYGDFRPGRPQAAVMNAQVFVLEGGTSRKPVYARTFQRRVDLAEASPAALASAYGTALGQILGELSADLARLPAR